jgi:hypothetical protein
MPIVQAFTAWTAIELIAAANLSLTLDKSSTLAVHGKQLLAGFTCVISNRYFMLRSSRD